MLERSAPRLGPTRRRRYPQQVLNLLKARPARVRPNDPKTLPSPPLNRSCARYEAPSLISCFMSAVLLHVGSQCSRSFWPYILSLD